MNIKILQVKEAQGEKVNTPAEVAKLMKGEAKADRECFWVLHLNTRLQIIEKELVGMGTLNASLAHPREIFKKAILNSASSIITVHNHPSGDYDPSEDDLNVWRRLNKAGEILDIKVEDNMIITPSLEYFSAKEKL